MPFCNFRASLWLFSGSRLSITFFPRSLASLSFFQVALVTDFFLGRARRRFFFQVIPVAVFNCKMRRSVFSFLGRTPRSFFSSPRWLFTLFRAAPIAAFFPGRASSSLPFFQLAPLAAFFFTMTRPSLSWAHRRHFSEVVLIVVFFSDRSGHWLFPGRTPRWIFFQLGPVAYFFYTAPVAVYFQVAPVNDFFQVATVADFFYRLRPSLSFCPGRAHGWLLFQVKTVDNFHVPCGNLAQKSG